MKMSKLTEIEKNNNLDNLMISQSRELESIDGGPIDNKSLLGVAIRKGDTVLIQTLLEEGGTLYTDKYTPFMLACFYGHLSVVKNLYTKNDLENVDAFGNTPLIYAVRNGHIKVIRWLLHKGADINVTNIHGDSALLISLRFHHSKTARMLLAREEIKPYIPNVLGYDSFVLSLVNNYLNIAKSLYFTGMDLNKKYTENNTLLHMCSMTGNADTVQWLLDHQANPVIVNNTQLTPFAMATIKGHIDVMKVLIPKIQHHHTFKTDLNRGIVAVSSFGYDQVMDLILTYKSSFPKGFIPFVLMNASIKGHWNVISRILDLSPEKIHQRINKHYNYGDFDYNNGGTLLHAAADKGHLTIVQNLVAKGAHLTHKNNNEDTVLHFAVRSGNIALVRWLCNHNIFVNPINKQGNTPMHFAVQTNHVEMVRCLLMYGSDFLIENNQKQTAEFLSKSNTGLYTCFKEFKAKDFKNFGLSPVFEKLLDGQDKTLLQILPIYHNLNTCSVNGLTPIQLTSNLGHFRPLVILLLWQANCDRNSAKVRALGLQKSFDPRSKAYATLDIAIHQIKTFPQERLDALLSLVSNVAVQETKKIESLSLEQRGRAQRDVKTSSYGIFASPITGSSESVLDGIDTKSGTSNIMKPNL